MASIDYSTVEIKEKPLFTPPLEEIVEVLSRSLPSTFEYVSVTAEETPDLTQPPYNLMAPGLTGDAKLVELGGPPYLVPLVRRDKLYDLAALLRHLRRDPALLVGAGAGPWPHAGTNCEGIINLKMEGGAVRQGSRIVSVQGDGYRQEQLPDTETRTALLGNYLLSEGKPGKVIKVVAKKRIGESNFITAIREALKNHYGEKVVGLGGAFVLRAGAARLHVMPDFSAGALRSDADVERWLRFFDMRAPLSHVGTLVTGDLGLDLRVQHFHGFGPHGDGGHYHYDTTPELVHYEGYFALAQTVVRIDAPKETHHIGRD
ncbi:ester hydrolase C11orf54 homolog [Vanessa tameamea]|uniref:Ester hydrolase C11orf54 homolog n=1 Tax=Vanessa tameamea TaxID=334116 RepID=A0A8B8IZ09_VANTA|nr:ester hydrolase C11orf54 homolog isoform X2 [Vanessa tameamea]XP_026501657.1 ester hydrolase C11orf54 homolog isoform X2 [Vanessa tameamea]